MVLTPRQQEILKAIIEEYIQSAQPIASVELVEKRGLKVSGATVRNVMSDLVRLGYLQMVHVSSGRQPTDMAYRYYISELMDEDAITVLDEVALKQKIWNARYELERLLQNATHALSETSGNLVFSMTDDGFLYSYGTSKLLDLPEFYEIGVTKSVLRFIDDYDLAKSILDKENVLDHGISVLIGREIGLANMDPVTLISAKFNAGDKNCYICMVGPARLKYGKIIPLARYMCSLLDEVGQSI